MPEFATNRLAKPALSINTRLAVKKNTKRAWLRNVGRNDRLAEGAVRGWFSRHPNREFSIFATLHNETLPPTAIVAAGARAIYRPSRSLDQSDFGGVWDCLLQNFGDA